MAAKKEHKTVKKTGEPGSGSSHQRERAEPSFKATWELLMSNKLSVLYILLIDAAFVIAAFYFRRFVELLAPSLTPQALVANLTLALYGLALIVVYYLLVLLLYSFAKFFVMTLVKGMRTSDSLEFERFLPFYGLNVLLMSIFFLIMLSLAYLFAALKQPYEIAGFMVLVVPYLLLLFVVLNFASGMFFAKNMGAWRSVVTSFKCTFNSIGQYGFVLGWNVLFVLVFLLVLFVPGYAIRSFADNPSLYASAYKWFTMVTSVLSVVVVYGMALFSRVAFYLIAEAKDDPSS